MKHPRGVRARLLTTVVASVAIALALMTAGFNILLARSLSRDADSVVRTRAATEAASVDLVNDRLVGPDQPDTGGAYTATTSYYLRPLPHDRTQGWPATRVELGTGAYFYPGRSVVSILGKFGWAAVPPDIAGIATSAVVRRFQARQSSSTGVDLMVGNADVGFRTLAFLSPAEIKKLDWYRVRHDG